MSQPKSPARALILEAAGRLMQDIRVMETCVAELRRPLQRYRGAGAPAVPTGDPGR